MGFANRADGPLGGVPRLSGSQVFQDSNGLDQLVVGSLVAAQVVIHVLAGRLFGGLEDAYAPDFAEISLFRQRLP